MSSTNFQQAARAYLAQAEADWAIAGWAFADGEQHHCHFVTMSQHAMEKAVKGLCFAVGFEPKRAHSTAQAVSTFFVLLKLT